MGVSIWEGNKAERIATALETIASGGGGGGTSNYNELTNKPSVNSVTLSGNKSLSDLGIHDIPSGGSAGQVLGKASSTDYDIEWVNSSDNYNNLTNKPSINSVTLSGNKTLSDLGIHDIPSGGITGQVLGKASGTDYDVEWITASASGGSTSILIAASNSSSDLKDRADFVCTGTNDQITINSAMNGMTGGEICLLSGDYYISGEINPVSNVDIKGFGNPFLHLTNRVVTTLAQAVAVNDETIYLTDPSDFVVGQKIGIKYGSASGNVDFEVGHIKTIDYTTGAVTMYARAKVYGSGDIKETVGKVNHAADAGSYVFTDSCVIMGWSKENVTISNLIIDGNSSNLGEFVSDTDYGANLIEWCGGNNIRILRNKLTNCYKHAVLFVYGTSDSYVCENVIDTALTHGIDFYTNVESNLVFGNRLKSANIQCHGGRKTVIANNILTNCSLVTTGGKHIIFIGNRVDNADLTKGCFNATGNGVEDVHVIGNIFIGGSTCLQFDNANSSSVSSNKFFNTLGKAIHLYAAKGCTVENNTVYLPNTTSNEAAIKIENASTKNIIIGNTIHGTTGKTSTGINETGESADYNVIANNVVFDAGTAVAKVGTNTVLQNNIPNA